MIEGDEKGEVEFLKSIDAVVDWGFMDDGLFIPVPKLPLIRAGHRKPPFIVILPNGQQRDIISRLKNQVDAVELPPEFFQDPSTTEQPQWAEVPPVRTQKMTHGKKIKVYTASKLNSAHYIRDVIAHWPEVTVTARWPYMHVDDQGGALWPSDAAHSYIFWQNDEEDVRKSDVVLVFGDPIHGTLKGALVEAGMAIALDKRVIVVGENEMYSTWQYHPRVFRVKDMDAARSLLSLLAMDSGS